MNIPCILSGQERIGGVGITSIAELGNLLTPHIGHPWSGWGNTLGNGDGDSTWWSNLQDWILNKSTLLDRKACVGMTKSVTLSSAVLGTTIHLVVCIGADQDADKTLTFQTLNCMGQDITYNSSQIKTQCQNYYNAFPGKSCIKTVSKGTCNATSDSRNAIPTYNDETVLVPSEREMGLDEYSPLSIANSTTSKAECTQGTNFSYNYYINNNSRIKKQGDNGSANGYWERSLYYSSRYKQCYINANGSASTSQYSAGLAPAFVIG